MLVAAAICPHPPLLIPEARGSAAAAPGDGIGAVLAACDAAVAALTAAEPDVIVVVGGAEASAAYDGSAAGSLRDYGVRYRAGTGEPVLPLSLTVGTWLLRRAPRAPLVPVRLRAVSWHTPVRTCLRLGAELACESPRVAMLTMGDGPARRAAGSPGAADPAADSYGASVAAALAGAEPARLSRLDPALDEELLVAGRAAWQVLAGAAGGRPLRGELRCAAAPCEVSYLVASWEVTDL